MASLITPTRKLITDFANPDEFEAFATAVLREANPAYASIIHVGTNVKGRAVRSPVDGIDIRMYGGKRRLLMVHHTITERAGLRRKWLEAIHGDVIKAKNIFAAEVSRGFLREATLVLTSTYDPDETLIRDVHTEAGDGLTVDFWPGSKIADFLDRNPEGQWLRQRQFGTGANRLSPSQARYISEQSLGGYLPLVPRDDVTRRQFDKDVMSFACSDRGAGFVIGESGLGKSVGLRKLADDWLREGGFALILEHEIIEQSATIELAIATGLKNWAPDLEGNSGHALLGLAKMNLPVLIIVEDINQSNNPRRIIEKLVGWSISNSSTGKNDGPGLPWRLLCPVWRGNAGLTDISLREAVLRNSLIVDRFERSEAIESVRARAKSAGTVLTDLQCNDLAAALGDDPLLIGLNRNWSTPSPQGAIESYVEDNIAEVANQALLVSDLHHALDALAERLVTERNLYPDWQRIRGWLSSDTDTVSSIRRLIDQGRIIALVNNNLTYRHDRVRDYLLTRAISRMIVEQRLGLELWADPFYSELIGRALVTAPASAISETARYNPVALFAALQEPSLESLRRKSILEAANAWVSSSEFQAKSAAQQQHHAMRYLARTDGNFAATLARRFPFSYPQVEPLVRNGDAEAGVTLCYNTGPGTSSRWRDRMIAHAQASHPNFGPDVGKLIREATTLKALEGALNLAGELGDTQLADTLATRWIFAPPKELTTGWLWAVLRCCAPIAHSLADTVCDAWGKLPTRVKRGKDKSDRNPRWDIAGYSLVWAFKRKPEPRTIAFLIARAKRDRRLNHILSTILAGIDLPEAVLFAVKQSARISRRTERAKTVNLYEHSVIRHWSPEQHGHPLSSVSRSALEPVWRSRRVNRLERRTAFIVWSQTPTRQEINGLHLLEDDPVLADAALRARLAAGDQTAIPLLRLRIWSRSQGYFWWFNAWRVGLTGLQDDVQRYLTERRLSPPAEEVLTDSDIILAELLMDPRDDFAVQILTSNWDALQVSPYFVQAALYIATPETIALAAETIAASDAPAKLFYLMDSVWGIRTSGRAGVTDLRQLQALEPYLDLIRQSDNGDMTLYSIYDAANTIGALEWRKTHLDHLVAETNRDACIAENDAIFESLDSEVETYLKYDRRYFAINHWVERREAELWERPVLLELIAEWARLRASQPAVELLCEAMMSVGERKYLHLLTGIPQSLQETCAEYISNCQYDVRRRSLSAS